VLDGTLSLGVWHPQMEAIDSKLTTARHRVEIKLNADQKEVITRAAALTKKGLSEFVRAAAERDARAIVAEHEKRS